mgnify:CR=1 FL=1
MRPGKSRLCRSALARRRHFVITGRRSSDDEYFLAIVPECDIKGYSVALIDKLDYIILKAISCQITVGNLLETVKQYFDEKDLNDSLPEYRKLILGRIKMLLSNKLISCKK